MTHHVLILCTHNSARSVLAEGTLNHRAQKLSVDVRAQRRVGQYLGNGGLYVLIEVFGPISGAHFNPASLRSWRRAARFSRTPCLI